MSHPAINAAEALGWSSTLEPVDRGRMHLVRHGRGTSLLLLHGCPEFWLTWRPVVERLAGRFDCLAPDLRGFGATGKWEAEPSAAVGPEVHARHLIELPDRLAIARVLLVGHDVGAYVAQALARLAPDRLAGLFLLDCPHPGIGARWAALRQIAEIWYQTFHQQPLAAALVGASRATCRAYLGHFLRHWTHRKEVFEAQLERWVDTYLEPGNFEGGFDWYRSIAPARLAAIEGRAPSLPPIDLPTRVALGPPRPGAARRVGRHAAGHLPRPRARLRRGVRSLPASRGAGPRGRHAFGLCRADRAPAVRVRAVLLAGLLLAAPAASLAVSPEELVRARCGTCHGGSLPQIVESCARRRGDEGLDAFLARHHARDPDERAAIVAHLRACPPGEPLPPR